MQRLIQSLPRRLRLRDVWQFGSLELLLGWTVGYERSFALRLLVSSVHLVVPIISGIDGSSGDGGGLPFLGLGLKLNKNLYSIYLKNYIIILYIIYK